MRSLEPGRRAGGIPALAPPVLARTRVLRPTGTDPSEPDRARGLGHVRQRGRSRGDRRCARLDVPGFPAWLALQCRWVTHLFRPDEVPETGAPLRALRLLPSLLVLESQGYGAELVQQRRALRDISPTFFRRYWRLVVEARGRAT